MTAPLPHPVTGIDHCFALVDDLDRAAAQYAGLGFTLSPRGLHSAAKGSANHTIMFAADYFELLGIVQPTALNAPRRRMLAEQGQGLTAIACRIDDANIAAAELTALGIASEGPSHFERPVSLPDGTEGQAAFSTLGFAATEVPRGTLFMCQHHTPEMVWLPELLEHRNSACGLVAILASSKEPAAEAAGFARLWAAGTIQDDGEAITIATGDTSAPLCLLTPAAMAARYPGIDLSLTPTGGFAALAIRVARLEAVADCLTAAGITPVVTQCGLAVPPEHAAGVIVEFVPDTL